jgi:hypothetical protein
MWTNLDPAEVQAIQELDTVSDRAAAIVGATIVESRVLKLLQTKLVDLTVKSGLTLHKRMFDNTGPLGSFSARINLGFMCKLFDESVWRDLNVIRGIRNDFAHVTAMGSFDEPSVAARCANLKACDRYFRAHKAGDPLLMLDEDAKPPEFTFYAPDLDDRLKDARQRYLLCIRYYATFLTYLVAPVLVPHFDAPHI